MSPQRVQRRRVAGQPGMPSGSKYVGRGTRWGNPFRVVRARSLWEVWYGVTARDTTWVAAAGAEIDATVAAVNMFAAALRDGALLITVADVRRELAGLDLACWCPPDQPCHADVLLAVVAGEAPMSVEAPS